jgi:hypothetical protein
MIRKALLTLGWAGLSGRVRSQTFACRRGDLVHTEWSRTMMACPPTPAGKGRYRPARLARRSGAVPNPTLQRRLGYYAAATVLGLRVPFYPALLWNGLSSPVWLGL